MHSFISHDYIRRLVLPMSKLLYMLIAFTPAEKPVRTCQCCLKCHFQTDGRSFIADLICLPLSSLDLILGMDWLLVNRVIINCSEKSIVFPPFLLNLLNLSFFFSLEFRRLREL